MRLGILLFTPIFLLAGVTLHAQEAVNAPEPAAAADSAANAELKAQLKAELLSEIRAELSSEVKTAVSKEADKPSRLTVGGYGEAVMTRNFFSDNYLRYISPDKYKNDKSHGRFDLPHVVIYLGYDFGRGWSMGTEIEFEHGGTESAFETEFEEGGEYESEIERGGEVALEQFWLQKSFSPAFNLRLGHMIVPVGGTNQHHMPTEFFGVYRPEGENTILPCTWHETGISLWGRAGDWRYEVMFLPGLDSDRFGDNGWVSGGAGSPYEFKIANAYAGAFRIDNYSVPGLRLSLSGYAGNSFSNTLSANRTGADRYKDVKGTVMIGAFDFLYDAHNWIVRGNFDYGHLTNSDKISQFNRDMPNASPSPKQYVGSDAIATGVEAGYDIDPHIDSWPLDGTALQNLLNNNSMMAEIERNPDYVSANLGYGLLGFHALEYMLFENAGPRALGKYTRPQLVYLVGVANDLCNMCVRLEASWAGLDNVTEEKQTILGDAELEPTFDYGASMRNSGKGGSKYRNYKDAAEEIIQGCIDIATEVGSQKIGRPANGTSSEDINYIESPYSQNSKTDFIDNIISIRNTYQGMTSGDASVSDWIEVVDPVLDTEVRNAISTAIEKIEACPAPFVDNRTAQAWKDAATYCNNDLVNALTKALTALSVEK